MSFRSTLILGMTLVIAVLLMGMVVSISAVLDRQAQEEVRAELDRAQQVLVQLWDLRLRLNASQTAVVAEEPRLKAVVGTDDITPATILGVAQDINRGIEADIFIVADARGTLLADVAHPGEHGHPLTELPGVATALRTHHADAVWIDESGIYQVHLRTIRFGQTVFGLLVMGWQLGEDWVGLAGQQTGTEIVLIQGEAVVASTLGDLRPGSPVPAAIESASSTSTEAHLADGTYLRVSGGLREQLGRDDVRHELLSSLDRALEPSRRLKQVVAWMAGGTLIIAALLALLLARRLSSPLDALVGFTRRVGAGDLSARAGSHGVRETRALADAMNSMVAELERSREGMASKERLEREMEIASQLQIAMLPKRLSVPGLEIGALMRPADEVGGDYYDVLHAPDGGAWLGVGDVSGHGLPAGVVMMMLQTAISAVVASDPAAGPSTVLARVNRIVYENVRERLGGDEHVTLCLLRFLGGGRFVHAGAHEDMLLWRAARGELEWKRTYGTWMGLLPDVAEKLVESELELQPGDVLVIVTDGVFESRDASGEMFGSARLEAFLRELDDVASAPASDIANAIMSRVMRYCPEPQDDITIVVVRYTDQDGDAV